MRNIFVMSYAVIIVILELSIGSFVFMKLYNWIIVVLFDNSSLGYIDSIALVLLASFMTHQDSPSDKGDMIKYLNVRILYCILDAVFYLFLGWLISINLN